MINDELIGYIKQQLSIKIGRERITDNLKLTGWTEADVNEAFAAIAPNVAPALVPVSPEVSGVMSNLIQPQPQPQPKIQIQPQIIQPQTQSQIQTQSSNPVTITIKKPKSKKIFLSIFILIFLSIAGGGIYAYYAGVFISLPNLVTNAMDNARASKILNYDVTSNIDFSELKNVIGTLNSIPSFGINSTQLSFNVKGSSDLSDVNNLKNSSVISVNLGSFSLEAALKMVHNIFYAELTKAPILGMLPIPSLSQYENKWFSFPYNSTNSQMITNQFPGSSPFIKNIGSKFNADQTSHLYQMFRDAHFIKMVQRFSPETITGELSYHFSFDLDRAAIVSYLQSLKEYVNNVGKNDSQLSAFDPTSFINVFDKLKDLKGEIWIERDDKLLHKITMSFGIQPDLAKNEQVKTNIVAIFSDWNKPILITAPTDSTPFADLISASISDAQQKGKEASIKANLANMRAQAEIFWNKGSSYSNFCLSKELKITRTAIENDGGSGFVCKDTLKAYVISVKLSPSSGYSCVDSTGAVEIQATTKPPTGIVCPIK